MPSIPSPSARISRQDNLLPSCLTSPCRPVYQGRTRVTSHTPRSSVPRLPPSPGALQAQPALRATLQPPHCRCLIVGDVGHSYARGSQCRHDECRICCLALGTVEIGCTGGITCNSIAGHPGSMRSVMTAHMQHAAEELRVHASSSQEHLQSFTLKQRRCAELCLCHVGHCTHPLSQGLGVATDLPRWLPEGPMTADAGLWWYPRPAGGFDASTQFLFLRLSRKHGIAWHHKTDSRCVIATDNSQELQGWA